MSSSEKIVEIYIDDVVIKSIYHESHLDDIRKTLKCTRKHVFVDGVF
jgi:hypothetical protein